MQSWGTEIKNKHDGQRRRLCVASAIAVNLEIILMDNPCSAMNLTAAARIRELMYELRLDCTHSMQQAARTSARTTFFHLEDADRARPDRRIFSSLQHKQTEDYISGWSD